MKLLDEIRQILAPVSLLDEQEIEPRHNLEADLGIDSFGTVDVVLGLESKFDISIEDKQVRSFITVQDVMDFISGNSAGFTSRHLST